MPIPFSNKEIEKLVFSGEEAENMRQYFGHDEYHELRDLADQVMQADQEGSTLGTEAARKRVYIVPGIMGSRLWASKFGPDNWIWLNPLAIAMGDVRKLKFGEEPKPVYASGVILPAYLKMKLRLLVAGYNADYLSFDWRQSIPDLGRTLLEQIRSSGERSVSLVCHSMGGLVARRIAELDPNRELVERIVTLGTPNFGSYAPVELCALTYETLLRIGDIDQLHTPKEIAEKFVRHFPGLIEMLPSPQKRPDEPYFTIDGWPSGGVRPLKTMLTGAGKAQSDLPGPDDRFVQIIGMGEKTVQSAAIAGNQFQFTRNHDGDGTVPRQFAEMGSVDRYYVDGSHGGLLNMKDNIRAVLDILETGKTDVLRKSPTAGGLAHESIKASEQVSAADLRNEQKPSLGSLTSENDVLGRLVAGGHSQLIESSNERSPVSAAQEPDNDKFIATAVIGDEQPSLAGLLTNDFPTTSEPFGTSDEQDGWLNGYPIASLKSAAKVWQGNEARREASRLHAEKGEALQGEPKVRQNLYAKHLFTEAQRLVSEEQLPELPPIVSESLQRANFSPEGFDSSLVNEAVMGEFEEFMSVLFLKRAAIAARSVGRIVRTRDHFGFGTGFMIAPGILITNNHVLPNEDKAHRSFIQFDYEITLRRQHMTPTDFDLRPDLFFTTNKMLDFTVVAVTEKDRSGSIELSKYSYLPLRKTLGKIRAEKPVNIIQHPQGERKQAVFRKSKLTPLPETRPGETATTGLAHDNVLQYTGDTKPGSSGSPLYSDLWEVVGLHHAAVPIMNSADEFKLKDNTFLSEQEIKVQGRQDDVLWVANEGIRVSKIIAHLTTLLETERRQTHLNCIHRILKTGEEADIVGPFGHHKVAQNLRNENREPQTGGLRVSDGQHMSTPIQVNQPAPGTVAGGNTLSVTIPVTISVRIGSEKDGTDNLVPDNPAITTDGQNSVSFLNERRYRVEDLHDRKGYDPEFLCKRAGMPSLLNTSPYQTAELLDGTGTELRYDHYSVLMCKERRLAFVSAGNFDPSAPFHPKRDKQPWSIDPRLNEMHQADNHFYKHNDLDRGHLFRRTDGSWGHNRTAALRSDHDTYFWTNIAPQHEVYNQSSKKKEWLLWGQLENHVTAQAGFERISIFNGPIFTEDDPVHRGLQIPKAFWKVVLSCKDGRLRAHAFKIGQETLLVGLPHERFSAGPFAVYQLKLRDLESQIHLDFGSLRGADVMEDFAATERFSGASAVIQLRSSADILL